MHGLIKQKVFPPPLLRMDDTWEKMESFLPCTEAYGMPFRVYEYINFSIGPNYLSRMLGSIVSRLASSTAHWRKILGEKKIGVKVWYETSRNA